LIPNPTLSPPGPPRLSLRGLGLIFLSFLFVTGFLMRAQPQWTDSVGRELSGLFSTSRHGGERNPSTSLKTITSAQADFRANDRDGDGINQFWRGDIAGLYALIPRNAPPPPPDRTFDSAIKLIELSVAAADDRPVLDIGRYAVRSPKAGYRFRALLHEEEKTPDPQRFAACAFPDTPEAGRWTFIVDENNTIFCKELGKQRGVDRFPVDPLRAGWRKLD